jgi:hypothetical protein
MAAKGKKEKLAAARHREPAAPVKRSLVLVAVASGGKARQLGGARFQEYANMTLGEFILASYGEEELPKGPSAYPLRDEIAGTKAYVSGKRIIVDFTFDLSPWLDLNEGNALGYRSFFNGMHFFDRQSEANLDWHIAKRTVDVW